MEPSEPEKIQPESATEPTEDPTQEPGSGPQSDLQSPQSFPIVGIGASAGGLSAFQRLFSHIPAKSGIAFVVIQHLSPPHKSILPEIIQRYTAMPVLQVTDGIEVQPNHVYVIPPSNNLALMDGHLILLEPPNERGYRFPIDFFFRSLAQSRKNQAIGIVLSGTASDGSLGIRTIKAEGGLTIAQDPETAEFRDMPLNAIATSDVDFILAPEKIGGFLLQFFDHQISVAKRYIENEVFSSLGSLQKLYYLLRSKTGHDFSLYKQNTLLRRIDRRMKIALVADLDGYILYLEEHPEEYNALFHEMLINVTQFFRDPEAFEALVEKVLQPLIRLKYEAQEPIRVWVAGCSTGEEAYSVAILIQEQLEAMKFDCKVQIYATDLDTNAITAARRGVYVDGSLEYVSAERLKRFFLKEEDGYHIKKSIRDTVVFSNQNLIFDPPFSKVDLLCCRNVLIYLQPELQKQLYPLFHYALNPGGFLFLGNSESVGSFTELFSTVNRKHKIFQRRDVINEHRIRTRIQPSLSQASPIPTDSEKRRASINDLRQWTEKELLKFHTPACVVIDEKYNILYVHGRTGKYLETAPGEASSNLLKMAREGLKADLATAIHTVAATKKPITRQGIRVKTNGDYQFINLTVRPVDFEDSQSDLCMIVFEEMPASPLEAPQITSMEADKNTQVNDLEQALKEKDDYLTSIINELEDANQELKSVNEELLSSNEEMQSSNEELETSREELQSINEELSTVNAELQNKNAELTLLNNDVYNLLASTDIGTIFLDLDLQLRRFTPAIQRVYHFLPGDLGRPLRHFHSRLMNDHLIEDIHQVLTTLAPKAIEAQTTDGIWYLVNIQPYRTLEDVIDGVVITFVDITKQKQRDELRRLETLLHDSNDAIIVQDFKGKILSWNQAATEMYGWSEAEALSMNIQEMIPEHLRESTLDRYRRLFKGENVRSYASKRWTRSGRLVDVWVTLSTLFDYTNRPMSVSATERDITDRKQTDQRVQLENRALKVLNDWYQTFRVPNMATYRYSEIGQILVQPMAYRLSWLGQVEPGSEKALSIVGYSGFEGEDLELPKVVQTLAKRSQKLVETALQSQQPIAIRNILTDPVYKSWRTDALKHRFNAFLVLPLANGKDQLGVLVIYAEEPEAFIDQEIESLQVLAGELSQALAHQPGHAG